jgi:pilus assembly protein CpaC
VRLLSGLALAGLLVLPAAAQQQRPLGPFAQAPSPLTPRPAVPGQATPAQATAIPAAPAQFGQAPAPVTPQPLVLESGTGVLLQFPRNVATVLAAEPRIARVQPASPTSVFLMGSDPGRTTVIATTPEGELIAQYDVTVRPASFGASQAAPATGAPAAPPRPSSRSIENAIRTGLAGGGNVRVRSAGAGYVLSGTVQSAADAHRAVAIAQSFAGGEGSVTNNIFVLSSVQVNLRVRVAEIQREITRALGFNWSALSRSGGWTIGIRSALPATAGASLAGGLAPALLGAGYQSSRWDINGLIDALAADRLISVLAEPNLTAQSGEVASFLAGGEFPVPVAGGNNGQLTIEFRQFGVSLAFVPTVLSNDRVNLRVRPEVSELSETGAVELPILGGVVRVPGLNVRRAETTVELGSGQSFAIAGLMQRTVRQTENGFPGLQDSILGPLFRSDSFRRGETELVILITPYIVRPVSEPQGLASPTDRFRPAIDLERILERRQIGNVSRARPGAPLDAGFIVE